MILDYSILDYESFPRSYYLRDKSLEESEYDFVAF